jgi:glycosyltransferase involved in cell wall biosynthesis
MPATTARFSRQPFRFVYVGRLVEEQKRASDMVRAMIAVLERNSDAEFCLCGDGPARPAVQNLIKGSGVSERIKLFGNVAAEEVQALLQHSQALVLLSDYEGIPIALLEAMGAGVVPLCLNIRSGIRDVIRHEQNGFLVEDRGASFVAAAQRLMRDPGFWSRCSEAARATVQEDFSVEANAHIWVELIEELYAGRPERRIPLEIPAEFDLPPVRSNPKGMAREDRRKPRSQVRETGDVAGSLPVVLVRSHEFNYSETFVEDHVNHLTKNLTLLYGYPFPRLLKGGRSVLSAECEKKLQAFASGGGTLTRELWEDYVAGLAAFLKTCGSRAALLESGLMASFAHEACERAGLPYVVHFHGVDAFGRELLARWSAHYRKFFQRAASLAVVSRAMRAQLLKLGAPADRVLLAPYGVAVDVSARADPARAGPRFVAVGRFVEKKAPHLTLQAFAAVHREVPAARLTMIGDGVLLQPCRQWAAEHGLDAAVTFAGVQSRADVSRHMAASGVFVQHSITASTGDSEGLPLAVLEAGAHGLPVVSTRHAGIPDAVREGVDGFLVAERDVSGMAAAMLRLARDPALAAKLGASFRARVEAHYSRRRSLERLHALLVAAAEGRSARSLGEPVEETSPSAESSVEAVSENGGVVPIPMGIASGEPAAPQDPSGRIAADRNAADSYLELAADLAKRGVLADAYRAAGEAHRLTGGTSQTRELLANLEEQGALGEPEVETYRRRAGWLPRRKTTQPRRILVVTNLLPPQEMGGYGRTMWEFSRELVARGHTVRVLTADMPHLLRKPSPEHTEFETHVRRVLRLCGDWKDGAAVAEPDMEKRRQAVKFNHQKILSFAKEFRPDAVMAGNLDFVGHHFMQELVNARIPVVHRLGNARPGYEAHNSPKSPLYCVAGGSEWVNERIRANGYTAGRFAVVPPGSPLTEYFRAFPPQRTRLRIAYAGLLMPYKGAHVLVDALVRVHRAGIAFHCTLAGDSTEPGYVEKLRTFARAQGFGDALEFPGFLSKSELAALYARSNVLVFPSLVDEVFGKTQVEAMAAGLVVISTGSGGAREVIRDGVTGLLVKSDDAGALSEALARVQRDPARAEKIAAAGQADAFRFTTAASVDRLENLIQELIATARRATQRPAECAA